MRLLPNRTPSRTAPTARLSDAPLASLEGVTSWPGSTVEVAGQQVYIRTTPGDADDGEPALFVHGLGGAATNWTDLAGLLRKRLAIEAIDLPGFGRSGPARRGDYSLNAHANTVIAYLDQSGRGPVHLVGNSMGGAISIIVAARRPDLVRTLTLVSPAVPDLKVRLHPLKNDWRMGLLVVPIVGSMAMRKMGAAPVETRVRGTLAVCFSEPSRLPAQRFQEMVDEAAERADKPWADQAMLRSTRGLVQSAFLHGRGGWAQMRAIQAPTLVLWGDEDKLVAPDLAPFVAAAIPGARLLVLEHVGHTAMLEMPEVTARAVLALIEDASVTTDAGRQPST